MRIGRVRSGRAVALGVVLGAVSALAAVAAVSAHDPIIVTDRQTSPDAGPLLPDGTISFALYGVVDAADDTRGFRVRFGDGDRLELSLLVPALDPEQGLAADALPSMDVVAPDGTARSLAPTEHVRFDESFSGTSYVRLVTVDEPALAGEYRITVIGHAPARFTVAVGSDERFGTPVENVEDRGAGVGGVQRWYATPPPVAPVATPAPSTSVVDTAPATSGADTTAPATTFPAAPVAADTSAAATSSVPGAAPTTVAGTGTAAGSAVFFGVIAVIIGAATVLVVRRTRR